MKKIIALIVTAVIMLLSTINVLAASSTIITADTKTAKYEETVAINVSIKGNTGFKAYGLKISYDKSALTLQGFSEGAEFDGYFSGNKTNGVASFASSKSITKDGVLFTVNFKVLTNVAGNYPVTIVLDKIGQSSSDVMQVTTVNGAVSVTHTHRWGKWEVTKKSSCDVKGVETRTCSECKAKDERNTALKDHSFGGWSIEKSASCISQGKEVRICSVCKIKEERATAKGDHNFGKWSSVKEATCQENGQEKRICSCCKAKETRNTVKLSHTYGEWNVTKVPTETQDGLKERTCSCGHVETYVITAGTIINSDNEVEPDNNNSNIPNKNEDTDKNEPSNNSNPDKNSGSIIWIVLVSISLLILLLLLLILLKRRKEDKEDA